MSYPFMTTASICLCTFPDVVKSTSISPMQSGKVRDETSSVEVFHERCGNSAARIDVYRRQCNRARLRSQGGLRSSSAVVSTPIAGGVLPTAPAGAVVVGPKTWACDASVGFAPVIDTESGVADPFLAIGTQGNIQLPISPTTVPATCGQAAVDSSGFAYVTQAIVDTKDTPSTARGVLRVSLDPNTGLFEGLSSYIATTAGLDGDQPTAAAFGPDGNLYVGFLKGGNVKRIVNPGSGTTQVVQSVGSTPQGHPARAFAFANNNLFIASLDAFSVILNATNSSCTGGCNAVALSDGFSGTVHGGMTSDGANTVYFAVAGSAQIPGSSQIWRYTPSNGLFAFVSQGGVDKNGLNASNFSFTGAKTNLLTLDASGNLWVGDDTSGTGAVGAGRLWTISAASLATLPAGSSIAGTNVQAIFNLLRGPWIMGFTQSEFEPTFNADGTLIATITSTTGGGVTTVSGTWTLSPPVAPQPIGNAQAHLTLTETNGVVLFSADFLELRFDQLVARFPWTTSLGTPISGVLSKATP